ncbi:cytochrome c oxidase assembly protein [Modestobacter sp. VKM Ac-2986]|uniref:cytochrome c oxidase assembly protein n=1 Tax=Modestobacter sp. VKM Ac-2986 TaxID=3004140 RepID=UPI0022AB7F0F|nr:cytochrome c oxidase assembly protein [Modestobacter sp. VKM Ac-2986]MCZ2830971.1 cytochrome c oxidase assembly protein [Modestobacter sp. VKM Ac-2986]
MGEHNMGGMGGDMGGMHMHVPELPPTLGRVLALDMGAASPVAWLAVLLAVGYAVGLLRLRQRGVRWSPLRTLAWMAGCASLFWVTASGLQSYGMALFSLHMIQHMVLTMITPLMLLMGAPVTLALRALPADQGLAGMPRRLLLTGLHSRLGQAVSSPLFTVPLFIASLYGVYFTPVFDDLMATTPGHTFMLLHFLATGMLFFGPILAIDPWPRRSGHGGRMLELLLPAPFHAFFGVIVMMSNTELLTSFATPPASWGIDPLFDQGSAGGIAWSFGEFPTVLVLAVVFFQWAKSEERSNKAADRVRDRAIARGESGDDPALVAYNERLRRMAAQNG